MERETSVEKRNSRPCMPQSSLHNPQRGGGTLRFVGQVRAGAASARSGWVVADSAEIRVPLGQAHLGRRNKGRQCLEFREHSGVYPMSYVSMKKGCADFERCPWSGYSTFCHASKQCHAKQQTRPLLTCAIGLSFQEMGDHGADMVEAVIYFQSIRSSSKTHRRQIPNSRRQTSTMLDQPPLQFHPAHIPQHAPRTSKTRQTFPIESAL